MKTYRLLLIAASLVGAASILSAGPSPQFTHRPAAPKPASSAATTAPAVAATTSPTTMTVASCATCACCKKTS